METANSNGFATSVQPNMCFGASRCGQREIFEVH